MLQISGIVICAVICCICIRKEVPSYAAVIMLAISMIISMHMLKSLSVVTGYISVLTNNLNIDKSYIKIIMKITGLSIATQLISDICKDNGYNAIASQLELLCRISVILISLPVIAALIEMVNGCLK